MRLLNIDTLRLHEFFENEIPRYAILSHRWEKDEVSFTDVTKQRNLNAAGWQKIESFCKFAGELSYERQNNPNEADKPRKERIRLFEWVWVDTCCIDKRSSAELSEAINSMYTWYRNAAVCYVYLNDVSCEPEGVRKHEDLLRITESFYTGRRPVLQNAPDEMFPAYEPHEFERSAWFTRGWTLQELIAPEHVLFVDKNWNLFGSKYFLQDSLSNITGIENVDTANYLRSPESVATKMSWAAKRECTRPEDGAYSLLGLFKVSMPLLYGEGGQRAFERLQLEIIKRSDDESIFAWALQDGQYYSKYRDVLAPSPRNFCQLWKLSRFEPSTPRLPYAMTNKGLQMDTIVLPAADYATSKRVFVPLCCSMQGERAPLAMRLACIAPGEYMREVGTFADSCLQWPEESYLDREDHWEIQTIHIVCAGAPDQVKEVLRRRYWIPQQPGDGATGLGNAFDKYFAPARSRARLQRHDTSGSSRTDDDIYHEAENSET